LQDVLDGDFNRVLKRDEPKIRTCDGSN